MHLPTLGAASATIVVILVAGCSSSATPASPGTAPAPASSAASAPPSSPASSPSGTGELTAADSRLGTIVVDDHGMTAYYFTKDQAGSGTSVCTGDCLVAWPAIPAASGTPSGKGITAKLGSITRDDGTRQVTVAGRPVYLFQNDKAPGDVSGQGVGKVWYAVAPDGTMITDTP